MAKKIMAKEGASCYNVSCYGRCLGSKILILGLWVGLNSWFNWFSWPMFIAVTLVVWGIVQMAIPSCPTCK